MRDFALWQFLQAGREGLPEFVEQARIRFDQRRPGQICRQRRGIDKLQEPAVEGIDREPRLRHQYSLVQAASGAYRRTITLTHCHAALCEKSKDLLIAAGGQQVQPVHDAFLDLPCGLARKSDRQNLAG